MTKPKKKAAKKPVKKSTPAKSSAQIQVESLQRDLTAANARELLLDERVVLLEAWIKNAATTSTVDHASAEALLHPPAPVPA